MIQIQTLEVDGMMPALHGMRNPKNSWAKQDSYYQFDALEDIAPVCIGENDHDLAMRLASGGPVHAKYRRMIIVYADITAPLYWWKEFDTYKIGTVANSCSTMHKIHAKEFVRKDFSLEHLISNQCSEADSCGNLPMDVMDMTIKTLNECRMSYLFSKEHGDEGRAKMFWWQMIQLLPSSYNQKRTVMMNYEVLANICKWRRGHKLDEWHRFVVWAEKLPYAELFLEKNLTEGKEE